MDNHDPSGATLNVGARQKSTTADHTQLCADIRQALGNEPDFTIWLNSKVSMVRGKPMAKPGLVKGASDLVGILHPGLFVALEVKTGDAVPSKEQKLFIALIRKRGGFARVVRSVSDAKEALQEARKSVRFK